MVWCGCSILPRKSITYVGWTRSAKSGTDLQVSYRTCPAALQQQQHTKKTYLGIFLGMASAISGAIFIILRHVIEYNSLWFRCLGVDTQVELSVTLQLTGG